MGNLLRMYGSHLNPISGFSLKMYRHSLTSFVYHFQATAEGQGSHICWIQVSAPFRYLHHRLSAD